MIHSLVQVYYALENYEAAEEVYEELIEKGGASNDLVTNLSATYVKSGNFPSLASLVSQNQHLFDHSFEFLYNAGTAFLERGDSAKAQQYLFRAKVALFFSHVHSIRKSARPS